MSGWLAWSTDLGEETFSLWTWKHLFYLRMWLALLAFEKQLLYRGTWGCSQNWAHIPTTEPKAHSWSSRNMCQREKHDASTMKQHMTFNNLVVASGQDFWISPISHPLTLTDMDPQHRILSKQWNLMAFLHMLLTNNHKWMQFPPMFSFNFPTFQCPSSRFNQKLTLQNGRRFQTRQGSVPPKRSACKRWSAWNSLVSYCLAHEASIPPRPRFVGIPRWKGPTVLFFLEANGNFRVKTVWVVKTSCLTLGTNYILCEDTVD